MISKNDARIKLQNGENHYKRLKRGFINREEERRALHSKRKFNNRKLTYGRLRERDLVGE